MKLEDQDVVIQATSLNSKVTVTHLPTGLWVTEGSSPSQYRNRERAMTRLTELVANATGREQQ